MRPEELARGERIDVRLPALMVLMTSCVVLVVFLTLVSGALIRSAQAMLMLLVLVFFVRVGQRFPQVWSRGWAYILIGMNLIAFGSLIAAFDHVFFLQGKLLEENHEFRIFLEQVIGAALGFTFLSYGFYRWIPSFLEPYFRMEDDLNRLSRTVEDQQTALSEAEEKARLLQDVRYLQELNQTMLETMPLSLLALDESDRIVSCNRHFEKTFGVSSQELKGQALDQALDDPWIDAGVTAVRRTGRLEKVPIPRAELPGRAEPAWLEVTISASSKGLVLLVINDVSKQRQAQQMEQQLHVQLMQNEKLSALGELVSGVAHELNNPLTIISGYMELMAEDEELSEGAREMVQDVGESAMRCKRIVENLLTFARQHKPNKKLVNVNEVLEAAAGLRDYQFRVDGITLTKDLEELPETVADGYQLQQVFFNIINNAYQAMKDWEGRRELRLSSRSVNAEILVEISDTGPGIPAENAAKIFDPFFTTKDPGEGTGLGLSISYGIVQEHGGTMEVRTEAGEGATFLLRFPLIRDVPLPGETQDERGKSFSLKGTRVLVIDDEELIGDICAVHLERLGCEVHLVTEGKEAFKCLEEGTYDLVISDVRMPGVSGKDIHSFLEERNPALARMMVFMTGDTVSVDTKSFLEKTGNRCLVKPFDLHELELAVVRSLEGRSGEAEAA